MPYLIGCSKSTTFPKKFRAGVPTFAVWSTEHESTILSYNHRLFLTSKNTRCMYRNSNPTCFDSIENWYVPVFYNTKHEYEIIQIECFLKMGSLYMGLYNFFLLIRV